VTPDDLAPALMRFAADLLKYECPEDRPEPRVEPDLECDGQIQWFMFAPPVITLRLWREGNLRDQAVLMHEMVHYIQSLNGVEMTGNTFYQFDPIEIEAVRVQCMWLQSVGADCSDYPSEKAIFKMTGDRAFASLKWLEVDDKH
jgi:hypothetical protein